MLRRFIAAIVILCALAHEPARADGYLALDANGKVVMLYGHVLSTDGGVNLVLPSTSLTDGSGNDLGPAHPLWIAPGIAPATPIDRGGTIAAANAGQSVMGSNTARKGGWITADPGNNGTEYVSYTSTASTSGGAGSQCPLTPGQSCPLTVNGSVIQTAVSIAGTVAGDKFEAVEFQ